MKCGRMSASMKWRCLGHLQPFSKTKYSLAAMAKKEVCPRDEIADPPGMAVLPIDTYGFGEGLVSSYTVWCAIVAGEICSESSDCLGSATAAGMVRDSVFNSCVFLS